MDFPIKNGGSFHSYVTTSDHLGPFSHRSEEGEGLYVLTRLGRAKRESDPCFDPLFVKPLEVPPISHIKVYKSGDIHGYSIYIYMYIYIYTVYISRIHISPF